MQQVYEGGTPLRQLNASTKKKRCKSTTQEYPKLHTLFMFFLEVLSVAFYQKAVQFLTPTHTSFPSQRGSLLFTFSCLL